METKINLTKQVIPSGVETKLYLIVRMDVGGSLREDQSKPINLSLVIDRSGSMRGPKLEFVKQAAIELIRRLNERDTFSLVAYDDVVDVPIPSTKVKDKGAIRRAVNSLTARGMTDLGGGWLKGCELVEAGLEIGQVTRILLLSDGLANRGITSPVRLESLAREKRAAGITTTTMGVGLDFNEDLLSRMAAEGGGTFYFIDSPEQASSFFTEELKDLQRVVGKNLMIKIKGSTEVRAIQQITDYPMEQQGGYLCFQMGEIFTEEERVAVFELSVEAEKMGKLMLGDIEVSYDLVTEDAMDKQTMSSDITIKVVKESKFKQTPPDPQLFKIALIQKAGRARRKAGKLADGREFDAAAVLLREMAQEIEEVSQDDDELTRERDMLLEEANDMEAGQERFDAYARKIHTQKSRHTHRYDRHKDQVQAMHMRHLDSREALVRSGPVPTRIIWGKQEMNVCLSERVTIGMWKRSPNKLYIEHT
jgi:Ca-activated chloride channel family protein